MAINKEVSPDLEEDDEAAEGAEAGVGEKQGAQPSVKTDADGNVTVEEGAPATRKERRASWKQAQEQARGEKERADRLQGQINELHSNVISRLGTQQQAPVQQGAAGPDPYMAYMSQLDERQEMIVNALRTTTDADTAKRYREQYYNINRERDRATLGFATQRAVETVRAEQAQRPQQQDGIVAIIQSEYPDVLSYRGQGGANTAFNWANARYQQLIAEGKPGTMATIREAMDEAAGRYQIRVPSKPAPTATDQARLGGVSAQAGARGNDRNITLSREQQRMAVAAFPDVDENAAYAKLASLLRQQEREPT